MKKIIIDDKIFETFPETHTGIITIKGNEIPSINQLVDLHNSISLKHVFLCGGEDLDETIGDIILTFAEGNEEFIQIGSDVNEPPEMNEVV